MQHLTDRVLFGAAYYHEYQPSPRLDEDLRLMKEAGFTVIRVGESVWSTWEPEDGRFDLDWLEPVLDGAHARGIDAVLGTPTYAVPRDGRPAARGDPPRLPRARHREGQPDRGAEPPQRRPHQDLDRRGADQLPQAEPDQGQRREDAGGRPGSGHRGGPRGPAVSPVVHGLRDAVEDVSDGRARALHQAPGCC